MEASVSGPGSDLETSLVDDAIELVKHESFFDIALERTEWIEPTPADLGLAETEEQQARQNENELARASGFQTSILTFGHRGSFVSKGWSPVGPLLSARSKETRSE